MCLARRHFRIRSFLRRSFEDVQRSVTVKYRVPPHVYRHTFGEHTISTRFGGSQIFFHPDPFLVVYVRVWPATEFSVSFVAGP